MKGKEKREGKNEGWRQIYQKRDKNRNEKKRDKGCKKNIRRIEREWIQTRDGGGMKE